MSRSCDLISQNGYFIVIVTLHLTIETLFIICLLGVQFLWLFLYYVMKRCIRKIMRLTVKMDKLPCFDNKFMGLHLHSLLPL